MRIVPPAEDLALHDVTKQCVAGPIDVLVATNPVGLRAWFEAADGWGLGDALRGALGAAAVVGRGPRVAQAARAVVSGPRGRRRQAR